MFHTEECQEEAFFLRIICAAAGGMEEIMKKKGKTIVSIAAVLIIFCIAFVLISRLLQPKYMTDLEAELPYLKEMSSANCEV